MPFNLGAVDQIERGRFSLRLIPARPGNEQEITLKNTVEIQRGNSKELADVLIAKGIIAHFVSKRPDVDIWLIQNPQDIAHPENDSFKDVPL